MIEFGAAIDEVKSNFFDREQVLKAAGRGEARMLSRFGAYVRQEARGLIRSVGKKGTPSKPGSPPKSRLGLLRQFIFFAFEERQKSVVIGPTQLSGGQSNVPQILEEGGDETIHPGGKHGRAVAAHYAARPYMHPAFEKVEREDLPGLLDNAIR